MQVDGIAGKQLLTLSVVHNNHFKNTKNLHIVAIADKTVNIIIAQIKRINLRDGVNRTRNIPTLIFARHRAIRQRG